MANVTKYYNQELDKLNKKYNELTKNYLKNYVDFNVKQFKFGLRQRSMNTNNFVEENKNDPYVTSELGLKELDKQYNDISDEIGSRILSQKGIIDNMQRKADELEYENNVLMVKSNSVNDVSLASKPFYNEERYIYYTKLIFILSLVFGSVGIIYLFKNVGVTGQVTSGVKEKAKEAITAVKGKAEDVMTNEESFNSMKNLILAILVAIIVIAVFVFILYLIRRARPSDEDSETKKAIDDIANSCKRDKTEEWYKSLFKKVTNFLAGSNEPQSN